MTSVSLHSLFFPAPTLAAASHYMMAVAQFITLFLASPALLNCCFPLQPSIHRDASPVIHIHGIYPRKLLFSRFAYTACWLSRINSTYWHLVLSSASIRTAVICMEYPCSACLMNTARIRIQDGNAQPGSVRLSVPSYGSISNFSPSLSVPASETAAKQA